jgi:hypothetical protein
MIDDLDKAIKQLLERELQPDLAAQIGISFAAPDSDFPPQGLSRPAVDLFLYDVRENVELRSPGWVIEHRNDGTTFKKRKPVRVDCSYLVTAWASPNSTSEAFDEHHLLSQVMKVLLRHPTIPDAVLPDSLKAQEPPLPATTLQPGRLQSVSEFWQALGGKPKAALNYTVTIAVVPDVEQEAEVSVIDKAIKLQPGTDLNQEREEPVARG